MSHSPPSPQLPIEPASNMTSQCRPIRVSLHVTFILRQCAGQYRTPALNSQWLPCRHHGRWLLSLEMFLHSCGHGRYLYTSPGHSHKPERSPAPQCDLPAWLDCIKPCAPPCLLAPVCPGPLFPLTAAACSARSASPSVVLSASRSAHTLPPESTASHSRPSALPPQPETHQHSSWPRLLKVQTLPVTGNAHIHDNTHTGIARCLRAAGLLA